MSGTKRKAAPQRNRRAWLAPATHGRQAFLWIVATSIGLGLAIGAFAADRDEVRRLASEIQAELEMKFSDSNDPGLYERRKRLRVLFGDVPRPYASRLATALEHEDFALGKLFRYKLSTPSRKELLGILKTPTAEEKEHFEDVREELREELEGLDPAAPDLAARLDRLRSALRDIPASFEHAFLEESILGATPLGKLYEDKVGSLDEAAQESLVLSLTEDWKRADPVIKEILQDL